MIKNDLLLKASRGEETDRPPVWVMRQAGRILKEYRDVRSKLSGFKELVETPELAAEVTLQPVTILGVDAAIIFSDILVVPEAMGLSYEMIEKSGPFFPETIKSESDLNRLKVVSPHEDLLYVIDAIKIVKRALNNEIPLIGFAGAPWTIFCYMIEGGGSKTFSKARKFLYTQPVLSGRLLDLITESTIKYLKAQIQAGANIVQLFDSWAGILGREQYAQWGLPYLQKITSSIDEVPVTIFAKGAWSTLDLQAALPCQNIGIDWNTPPAYAIAQTKNNKTLQGNLDPCLLYSDFATIKKETEAMLSSFQKGKHIANLGHGVYPDTNPDHVKCFIDTVKNFSWKNL